MPLSAAGGLPFTVALRADIGRCCCCFAVAARQAIRPFSAHHSQHHRQSSIPPPQQTGECDTPFRPDPVVPRSNVAARTQLEAQPRLHEREPQQCFAPLMCAISAAPDQAGLPTTTEASAQWALPIGQKLAVLHAKRRGVLLKAKS